MLTGKSVCFLYILPVGSKLKTGFTTIPKIYQIPRPMWKFIVINMLHRLNVLIVILQDGISIKCACFG